MPEQNEPAQEKSAAEIVNEGGKPLEDALKAALSADDSITSGQPHKAEENNGDDAPEGDEPDEEPANEPDGGKPDGEPAGDEPGDEPADGGEQRPANGDQPPKKKNKSVEKLLHQRNSARDEAKAKQDRIDQLERENAALKSRQNGGEDPAEDPAGDDPADPDAPDDVESVIDRKLDERENKRKSATEKASLDKQERDSLMAKFAKDPVSKDEVKAMDAIINDNPKLSDEAALRIVSPHRFAEKRDKSGARRQEAGASTRSALRDDVDPNKMTTAQQKQYLEGEAAAGRLNV